MFKLKKKILLMATVVVVGIVGLVGCDKESKQVEEKDNFKITLVLDKGGVNDQSFNQSAWEGAQEAEKEFGNVEVSYLESTKDDDYLANIETAVDNDSDLIIGVGFQLTEAIGQAAELYPEENFAVIDGTYENILDNVKPILFNEEQSGYTVGLIAGKMTKTNKLGFIGGMDIPSVTNFLVGFEKGVKEVNPNAQISSQYANSFTDASKGKAISQLMVSNGADIIFTAGGGVNNGVIETCQDTNTKAIGVDMPTSHISPDVVLTSALKNVGTGVKTIIKDLVEGNFKGGEASIFDLSNNGVGYEETALIPEDIKSFVDEKIKNSK